MAAVTFHLIFTLVLPLITNKVLLQKVSGALLTQTDSLHIRRHHLILRGEILGVVKLVNLNSPPLSIFKSPTSSPPSLNQSSWLVVRTQENDDVNFSQVTAKEHLIARQVQRNLWGSFSQNLLSWRKQTGMVHYQGGVSAVAVLVLSELH